MRFCAHLTTCRASRSSVRAIGVIAPASMRLVIYFYGGPIYASCACNAAGTKTLPFYFIGWGVLLLYLPLYFYRKRVEDPRDSPAEALATSQAGVAGAGN